MDRIFLAVIVAAMVTLIASTTLLVRGTGQATALASLSPAQDHIANAPQQSAVLPLSTAAIQNR